MHPDRAERDAGIVEPLIEETADVQRRLSEVVQRDRARVEARQVSNDRRLD